ncbi:MAG TPA: S8 family serine peptidase, partial [Candidatus Binatia bacterium]|nr:S8 family serine peptidase [Candidatus Binatia bacterium]
GYFTEPFFQDGIIAQAVDTATAQANVTYVSAAGNQAGFSYEHVYADEDADDAAADFHDFDDGEGVDTRQQITLPEVPGGFQSQMTLVLQWDDPFYTPEGVLSDYDVFVTDVTGTVEYARSDSNNLATQEPLEIVSWRRTSSAPTTAYVSIERVAGNSANRLKYVLYGADSIDSHATDSPTVVGHPAATGAIAVGAVPFHDPETIETFSARGDATILFTAQGDRLSAPQVRTKPDVVAPDGVNTTFFPPGGDSDDDADDHPNFPGTSAAAPHVAAVAGLMLASNPHLTPGELYTALTQTASDLGDAGVDAVFGHGLVDADGAVAAAATVPDITPPAVTLVGPLAVHGWSVRRMSLRFSEPISEVIAENASAYLLTGAGTDGQFGGSDDIVHPTVASYEPESYEVELVLAPPAVVLPEGRYRLAVESDVVADAAGNPLNGGVDVLLEFELTDASQTIGSDPGAVTFLTWSGKLYHVSPRNPVIRFAWPQLGVGTYDETGRKHGPAHTIPTDILYAFGVRSVDVAATQDGGMASYAELEVPFRGDSDIFDISYQRFDADGRAVGGRIRVSSIDAWHYPQTRTLLHVDGSFSVAWIEQGEGPNGLFDTRILAQPFDSTSTAAGDPYLLTGDSAPGAQFSMSNDASGDIAAAWLEPDDTRKSVLLQVFDASFSPLSDAIVINAEQGDSAINPQVIHASDGSIVVAWAEASAMRSGLFFRRFDQAGQPLTQERRLAASDPAQPYSYDPAISQLSLAGGPDGGFVLVWQAVLEGDLASTPLYAQRIGGDDEPIGCPTWVDEHTATSLGTLLLPRVVTRDGGDFLVTWNLSATDQRQRWFRWETELCADDDPCTEDYCDALFGCTHAPLPACEADDPCRFGDVCGAQPEGAATHVTSPGNSQIDPDVAGTWNGGYVAAWSEYVNAAYHVFVRRYDAGGTALSDAVQVDQNPSGAAYPAIGMANDGSFVVVWNGYEETQTSYHVYMRLHDAEGTPITEEVMVDQEVSEGAYSPTVAMAPNGRFVVAWQKYSDGFSARHIRARRYSVEGQPEGDEFEVSVQGEANAPAVAINDAGEVVIAWSSYFNFSNPLFFRSFDGNGDALG